MKHHFRAFLALILVVCLFAGIGGAVCAVDAGDGNIGAKTVDDQKTDGEEDALAQIGGLAQRTPAEVGGHLLGS